MTTIPKKWKVTNWPAYNKGLVNRGNLTIMVDLESMASVWYAESEGKEGAQKVYADTAIEMCLTMGALFNLRLRQTQGFVEGLFDHMGLALDVPDYTTLSRRGDYQSIRMKTTEKDAVLLLVDSTGLKLHGEGEWKVRKHGYTKRRNWKKLHIGIDSDGEICSVVVTDNDTHDCEVTQQLLTPETTGFGSDGAYDTKEVYDLLEEHSITDIRIPPRKNAVFWEEGHPRNDALREIEETSLKE